MNLLYWVFDQIMIEEFISY